VRFEESLDFEGDSDSVWRRVSSVRDIPRYWHGTKELRVNSIKDRRVEAEVRFAFGGSGAAQIDSDEGARRLIIRYISGPFKGTQMVTVLPSRVTVEWDVRFNGLYGLLSRFEEKHFREGSKNALRRLCEGLRTAERPSPQEAGQKE
jgi:hypothetical protein